jgi:hypothetical protein
MSETYSLGGMGEGFPAVEAARALVVHAWGIARGGLYKAAERIGQSGVLEGAEPSLPDVENGIYYGDSSANKALAAQRQAEADLINAQAERADQQRAADARTAAEAKIAEVAGEQAAIDQAQGS